MPRRRPGLGVAARVLGLGVLAALLAATLALMRPPAERGPVAEQVLQPAPASGKVETRLPEATARKAAAASERARSLSAAAPTAWAGLTARAIDAPFRPAPPMASGAEPYGEWRSQAFATVAVVDGRTLQAGAVRIRLAGLTLPGLDEVCRTLDGRLEACAARAATQLELLTRHRKVHCHFRTAGPAEDAVGQCRIGESDLAERMVRTGRVRRAADAARLAATPD